MTSEPKWRSTKTGCRVTDRYARLHPERVYNDAGLHIFDASLLVSDGVCRDGPYRFEIGTGETADVYWVTFDDR